MGKEGSRLIQYAVIARNSNYPFKQYFWASEEQINYIFKICSFDGETSETKHNIEMKHIVFTGNSDDIKKSKKSARAEFIPGRLGSLEFHIDTEEDANKCADYLKLPRHFPRS